MSGGGPANVPPIVYDLTAPRDFPATDKAPSGLLAVMDPTAIIMFDTQKILIRNGAGTYSNIANSQWADNLPKLFQARIVQSFENARQLSAVSRPLDQLTAEYRPEMTIRSFQLLSEPSPAAVIAFVLLRTVITSWNIAAQFAAKDRIATRHKVSFVISLPKRYIDNIRDVVIAGLTIAPVRNRFKVFIIDEVHQLSSASFNALLKSIEEPPPHVVFMMATTELHKIPDTILSRSQVFEFRTIPTGAIGAQLKKIAAAEEIQADEAALMLIARAAEGSMRDAQSALDQVIAFAGKTVSVDDVSTVLGLVGRDLLMDVLDAVVAEDGPRAFALTERAVESGTDLRLVCRELSQVVRDMMVMSVDPSRVGDAELAPEERERLAVLTREFLDRIARLAFDDGGDARHHLRGDGRSSPGEALGQTNDPAGVRRLDVDLVHQAPGPQESLVAVLRPVVLCALPGIGHGHDQELRLGPAFQCEFDAAAMRVFQRAPRRLRYGGGDAHLVLRAEPQRRG